MPKPIEFWALNPDTSERLVTLPTKNEVCPRCKGEGVHPNPAVDGFSRNDEWVDDDFIDNYMAGTYDVRCERCNGERLVPVPDEERCDPADLAAYEEHLRDIAEHEAERRAEMRMGA